MLAAANVLRQLRLFHAVERRHRLREVDVLRSRAEDAERVQAKRLALLVALAHVAEPFLVRPVPVEVETETGCRTRDFQSAEERGQIATGSLTGMIRDRAVAALEEGDFWLEAFAEQTRLRDDDRFRRWRRGLFHDRSGCWNRSRLRNGGSRISRVDRECIFKLLRLASFFPSSLDAFAFFFRSGSGLISSPYGGYCAPSEVVMMRVRERAHSESRQTRRRTVAPSDAAVLAHDERVRFDFEFRDVVGAPVPLGRLGRRTDRAEAVLALRGRLGGRSDGSVIRVFAIALCFLGGGGAGFSTCRLLAPSGDCGRFFLGLSRLVLLQSVSVESRTESEKVQERGRFGRANVPNLDVVTLDHVAHLLVREQLGNLDDVVVVLLGSVRELFPVLLVPRDVPERAERDFAEGEDRLGHVAFLRLEEHQGSVQGVDACRVVHRHLSNALEQLGDWRGVVAISEKGTFLTKRSSPSLTRLVTVLVGRSPNDVDSVIFASRRSFDD